MFPTRLRLVGACCILVAAPSALRALQVPRLTLEAEIGCESCDGPTRFGTLLDVAVDDSGRILAVVDEAPVLRMFDRSGKLVWSSGSIGTGPGEFRRPMRAALGPDRIQVVDMTLRRITRIRSGGNDPTSVSFRGFPTATAALGRTGRLLLLIDDFRGGLALERWTSGDSAPTRLSLPAATEIRAPGALVFPAIAATPSGAVALARDGNTYRLELLDGAGTVRRTVTRDVPRVERTKAEQEALDRIAARAASRVRAERGTTRPSAGAPRPAGDPALKPHIAIDGLRYDDAGRLWVRTMRGDETETVFDVFSPGGDFLGEVRLAGRFGAFSFAGPWLAASVETDEGFPVVRVYRVR